MPRAYHRSKTLARSLPEWVEPTPFVTPLPELPAVEAKPVEPLAVTVESAAPADPVIIQESSPELEETEVINVPGYGFPTTNVMPQTQGIIGGGVTTAIVGGAMNALAARYLGTSTAEERFTPSGPTHAELGMVPQRRRRRRRRKLLTCSDKADIAFLHGQLGSGQLGRAAISALLSRRCG